MVLLYGTAVWYCCMVLLYRTALLVSVSITLLTALLTFSGSYRSLKPVVWASLQIALKMNNKKLKQTMYIDGNQLEAHSLSASQTCQSVSWLWIWFHLVVGTKMFTNIFLWQLIFWYTLVEQTRKIILSHIVMHHLVLNTRLYLPLLFINLLYPYALELVMALELNKKGPFLYLTKMFIQICVIFEQGTSKDLF